MNVNQEVADYQAAGRWPRKSPIGAGWMTGEPA